MSIKELYPSKSNALKAADLKGQQHTLKINGMEIAEFNEGKKLVLKFVDKEKGLVLNKTNSGIIADSYGDDESSWVGQEIVVYPDKTMFGADLVDCIRVRIPTPDADTENPIPF